MPNKSAKQIAVKLTEEQVRAIVRSFRLTVSQTCEPVCGIPVESVRMFKKDFETLERLAQRLNRVDLPKFNSTTDEAS